MDEAGRLTAAPIAREHVVAVARSWIDTPYRHQASEKNVGADCLGLVRGVWRELYGDEPETPPPYTPHWAEFDGQEALRDAARRHLIEVDPADAREADVLLFRMCERAPAKHAAVIAAPGRVVHAYWGRAVVETTLTPWWLRRRAYAFSFPNLVR